MSPRWPQAEAFSAPSRPRAASTNALEKAYGVLAAEARLLDEDYARETVCTDGWEATQSAWEKIFPPSL